MAAYVQPEIKVQQMSSSSSSEDSDFDDVFSGGQSISQTSSSSEITTSKSKGKSQTTKSIQRLPTRRPDPNVSNRNALLARENRRKKKAYVEALEKELDEMKTSNKQLQKLLRKQTKMVKKLENEKQYYKGLISNQSDILNLVSVLNTKVPALEMLLPTNTQACSPTDSTRSASSVDPSQSTHSYDYTDNDSNYEPYIESNWDQLLGMTNGLLPEEDSGFCPVNNSEIPANVTGEHNYFNSHDEDVAEKGDALCLHIASDVNFEYSSPCHVNMQSKHCNDSLPEELLVVD